MNGHTAMIRYWPGHGCYSCDNARCRIIAKNSVCGFTVFSSSTKDIDLSITHRHATILLSAERILYMHPVVLNWIIAVYCLGEPTSNINQIV